MSKELIEKYSNTKIGAVDKKGVHLDFSAETSKGETLQFVSLTPADTGWVLKYEQSRIPNAELLTLEYDKEFNLVKETITRKVGELKCIKM